MQVSQISLRSLPETGINSSIRGFSQVQKIRQNHPSPTVYFTLVFHTLSSSAVCEIVVHHCCCPSRCIFKFSSLTNVRFSSVRYAFYQNLLKTIVLKKYLRKSIRPLIPQFESQFNCNKILNLSDFQL